MRDSERSPPPAGGEGQRLFYVINLCAAPVPLPLEVPGTSGLDGLVVFRSHQVQDGRHRYRLHLGYFDTREAAERILPRVLPRFPTAWIATAPRAHLGSLDDTGATDFKLIQAPSVARPGFSHAADSESQAPTAAQIAEAPWGSAAAAEEAAQRYAVQLVWSSDRLDPADLPPIAIFEAYTLYTVTCQRGGVRLFGVRLGFFRSAISASQVAVYVRPDFPSVAVVPVSDREFAYASWLVRHRSAGPVSPEPPEPVALGTAATGTFAAATTPSATPDAATTAATSAPAAHSTRTAEQPARVADEPRPAASAQVVRTAITRTGAADVRTPTQAEIAQIRSPDEIPLLPMDSEPGPQPEAKSAPTPARPAQRRVPAPDRDARLAALSAHEGKLRETKPQPQQRNVTLNDMRPTRSKSYPDERSALARLFSRFTDRH